MTAINVETHSFPDGSVKDKAPWVRCRFTWKQKSVTAPSATLTVSVLEGGARLRITKTNTTSLYNETGFTIYDGPMLNTQEDVFTAFAEMVKAKLGDEA